jgi:hypothetical protein
VNNRKGKPNLRDHLSVVRSRNTREKKSYMTKKKEKNAKKNAKKLHRGRRWKKKCESVVER